ncbi:VWA domain-containing protein [Streptomyces recifensis]|uniref:VWA domain-containing protein n=1 Tax=Streptomyces recifensis TaxID=67355 RepID=UPI000A3CD545|nr:VWA domain-containing protein [Streptomyces recifensis]
MDSPADLPFDERRADALITVTAHSAAGPSPRVRSAQVLIMDRSLSMSRHKLDEAKRAMRAAIDTLRDGTLLAIVAGNHQAEVIFPPTGGMAVVDARSREDAKLRVAGQLAEGGTAIGQWLDRARDLFASVESPGTVRHAVLYTDGKDEHETPEQLAEILASCADRFICHARGLGEDWHHDELLRITQALHGTAEAVVTIADLTEDFTRLMREAQRIVVPRLYLGLRLNSRFRLAFVRQTRPIEADLTSRQSRDGETHVPLGSWPAESRQYQVSLRFDPDTLAVDELMRAARVTLHAEFPDGTRRPCSESAAMAVRRRATPGFGMVRSPDLTRVENERELGMAMRACADAQLRGDLDRADHELRLATGLAESLGDTARLRLLRAVATTGPDGRPRLRRDASRGQMLRIGVDSTKTVSRPAESRELSVRDTGLPRVCPRCDTTATSPAAKFCEECGHPFGAGGPVDAW